MTQWIILLRGVNVGGKNILPMKNLRDLLEHLGHTNVKTYIQSGNCILEAETNNADDLAAEISTAIETQFGFVVPVIAISKDRFAICIQDNPYKVEDKDFKTVHFFFLYKPSSHPDFDKLEALRTEAEDYTLTDKVFYLHAPDGIGRSKLAAKAEACLGVPTTARNLRSVTKIMSLAD